MSVLWTRDAAVAATSGQMQGSDWVATGVSIDTRTLKPGDIFVALSDARDGHDFVADALSKGAAAALVSHIPSNVESAAPLLIVDDVLAGLERLAIAARARTKAQVIAVTGSAGKTSTKEMLRHVLVAQGRTHAAEASYNNHWGVPLTLARMPADTDFAIVEIGMNHPGEIAPLSKIARPNVAIVTTVAAAHLEAFDDIEGIAFEKASIFEGLEPEGAAVFNSDVETAMVLHDCAKRHSNRLVSFGILPGATLHCHDLRLYANSSVVRGTFRGDSFLFKVGAPGRHFAMNALAVYGAACLVGADAAVVACDIATWTVPEGRGRRKTLTLDTLEDLRIDLIDDAFNANPASMIAAFEVLAALDPTDGVGRVNKGRRVAILGDMLELGPSEQALHAALADHPAMDLIDQVHCVGPKMRAMYEALPEARRGRWTESANELAKDAHKLIDAGDVVLVKGSKGSRVSQVAAALAALDRGSAKTDEQGLE